MPMSNPLPAQGSTAWYPWATEVHNDLHAIEAGADVTNSANVELAGAVMDSEVDANILSLTLPASTTISDFGADVVAAANAAAARAVIGSPAAADLAETVVLTQIEFSAITPDPQTLYYIVG